MKTLFSACCISLLMTLCAQAQTNNDAWKAADVQLRFLLEQTALNRKSIADKSKLMPRGVEKDGSLRLVGIGALPI